MRALRRSSRHGALSALLLAVLAGCTGEAAERTTDDASASALTTVALAVPPAPAAAFSAATSARRVAHSPRRISPRDFSASNLC